MEKISWEIPVVLRFPARPFSTSFKTSKLAKAVFFTLNKRKVEREKSKHVYTSLVSAFTTCQLSAEIHQTDSAVRQTAFKVAAQCEGENQALILALVYHPNPLKAVYRVANKSQPKKDKPSIAGVSWPFKPGMQKPKSGNTFKGKTK